MGERRKDHLPSLAHLARNPLALVEAPPAGIAESMPQIASEFFDKMTRLKPPEWLGDEYGYALPMHLGNPPGIVTVAVVQDDVVFSADDLDALLRIQSVLQSAENRLVFHLVWGAMHQALSEAIESHGYVLHPRGED